MAADEEHEAEALEWSEGLIGDVTELLDAEWQERDPKVVTCGENMTLVIDMAPETEKHLRDEAARKGMEPERYVLQAVEERLRWANSSERRLSRDESELMMQINEGLPVETWEQYHALVAELHAETLTPERHKTLLALTDQVEIDYAQRLERLIQLARLRGTSLEEQMQTLGIPQRTCE